MRHRERTDDAFVEASLALISARVGGTVIEVAVDENQPVKAGDLLVRLDPTDFEVSIARARANLEEARNRMASARADAEAAEAEQRAASIELERAKGEAKRVEGLKLRGAPPATSWSRTPSPRATPPQRASARSSSAYWPSARCSATRRRCARPKPR